MITLIFLFSYPNRVECIGLFGDFLSWYLDCQSRWDAWGRLIFCGLGVDAGGVRQRGPFAMDGKLVWTAASRVVFFNYSYDIPPNSWIYDFHNMLVIPVIPSSQSGRGFQMPGSVRSKARKPAHAQAACKYLWTACRLFTAIHSKYENKNEELTALLVNFA